MSEHLKSLKKDLRNSILIKTRKHSDADLRLLSDKVFANISKFLKTQPGLWGAYKPLPLEPQISFGSDKCFPKVVGDHLQFFKDVTQWSTSNLSVQEPVDGTPVSLDQICGVFIPAVAFHQDGQRLGRGKGYYDKTLAQFQGLKVGISFQFNILNDVPVAEHDIAMDYIITDEQIIQIQSSYKKTGDF